MWPVYRTIDGQRCKFLQIVYAPHLHGSPSACVSIYMSSANPTAGYAHFCQCLVCVKAALLDGRYREEDLVVSLTPYQFEHGERVSAPHDEYGIWEVVR